MAKDADAGNKGDQEMSPENATRGKRAESENSAETPATPAADRWWRKLWPGLRRNWLPVIVVVTLLIHSAGLVAYKLSLKPPVEKPPAEVSLGDYRYAAEHPEAGAVTGADFALHVLLFADYQQAAREQFVTQQFRIRQQIEQLLRQARGTDFEDPSLAGLKRQLQEQLNQALGSRAVAEVIVTNLRLQLPGGPAVSAPTVSNAAWNPTVAGGAGGRPELREP